MTDHRVCGVEDVEESTADGGGHDVVLLAAGAGADPSQRQKHCQWRAHAKEVLHLRDREAEMLFDMIPEAATGRWQRDNAVLCLTHLIEINV